MQFLKEGIRHGNYCCYIDMAEFYEDSDRYGDAEKCYRSFFFEYDKGNGRILSDMEYESSIGDQYFWACINYIRRGVEHNWDIKLFEGMRPMARDILEFFNKDLLNRNPTDSRSTVRSEYDTVRGARDWVAANLFRVQMPATRGLPNVSPLTGSDRLAEPTKPRRNWWRW